MWLHVPDRRHLQAASPRLDRVGPSVGARPAPRSFLLRRRARRRRGPPRDALSAGLLLVLAGYGCFLLWLGTHGPRGAFSAGPRERNGRCTVRQVDGGGGGEGQRRSTLPSWYL